jgi:hypothetical protein
MPNTFGPLYHRRRACAAFRRQPRNQVFQLHQQRRVFWAISEWITTTRAGKAWYKNLRAL